MTMCQREGASLQRGMNFRLTPTHSVVLMSTRPGAPYHDQIIDDGMTLIYEGHDEPKTVDCPRPKDIDQPQFSRSGTPTQNGKFHQAAQSHKAAGSSAEIVRVYEKIKKGIWSFNGAFALRDSWIERDCEDRRNVFKFRLEVIEEPTGLVQRPPSQNIEHTRLIPAQIKLEVFQRDGGKCVECGASDNLHFDHLLPYSKGGTSLRAENIQLLCARHNLTKSDKLI